MNIAIIVLTSLFVAANVWVEYKRRRTDNWRTAPMSQYLTGAYGEWQSAGYGCLCVALVLLAIRHRFEPPIWVPFLVAATALALVVATKWRMEVANLGHKSDVEEMHVLSAGIAFLALTVAEIAASGFSISIAPRVAVHFDARAWFPFAGIACVFLASHFERGNSAALEKPLTLALMLWILIP